MLIALGAGGFASLLRAVPSLPSLAAWGGALFLVAYSLRAFAAALRPQALTAAEDGSGAGRKAAIATALALSLLNPPVYLDTVVLLRSEEHTSELQSLMRISYAVFILKKKK